MNTHNTKDVWIQHLRTLRSTDYKYTRGSALVMGGEPYCTGASKLAALSALRAGAGVVGIMCNARTLPLYAPNLMAVMTRSVEHKTDLKYLLKDGRHNAYLIGPGSGVSKQTFAYTKMILKAHKTCVIDADALSVFSGCADVLGSYIKAPTILTPHLGEFYKLTGKKLTAPSTEPALFLAKKTGAVVILKGHQTIIAAPDGRCVVNTNAPATLATAGSGDVLSGIVLALLSNQLPCFEAACAGVWIHTEAASTFGIGLIAEDIIDTLPTVLKNLHGSTLSH